jgi:hypothetical protein
MEDEASNDDLDRIVDGLDPEDKAAEQRAILASPKPLKNTEDDPCTREEANEEQRRRTVDVSIQRVSIEEVGHRFFVEERQQLLEDAAKRRALFAGLRRMQRLRERRREAGGDRAGQSSAQRTANRQV